MEATQGGTMRRTALAAAILATSVTIAAVLPAAAAPTTPDVNVPMPPSVVGSAEGRAFVPVQRFWSARRDISFEEVRAAVGGESNTFSRVLVAVEDPAGLWATLGVAPADSTTTATLEEIGAAVDRSRHVLGLVPLDKVRPDLRALSVDGRSLFGGTRNDDLSDWPLTAQPAPSDLAVDERPGATAEASAYAPGHEAPTWTLAAAGDVMLDREVYRQAILLDRGPDHPWDGGFAEISSRTCCTVDGGNAIETKRVGPRGAVRDLLSSADVAVVNHEGPAPDDSSYHPSGLVFTFDPALLEGVAASGIDIVSLANNHIRNAGSSGVLQTMRNLRTADLRSVGAGADADQARKARCLDRAGVRLCFLAYDAINTVVHAATLDRPGAAELQLPYVRRDIRRARRDGADVIAVLPHWGTEYTTRVTPQQRRWARSMVQAGADIVLGAHSHVVGPVEFIDGVPVLYSLGDFLFDLPRFESTEEAVIAELTFDGSRLAQLELHPTVIVDRSQVALLDPAEDGAIVLERMRAASKRLD
jgi:poly-gamma-glutamate capsule biosynthesis protein CapA/YwtB (metallophosphatase superfamily)